MNKTWKGDLRDRPEIFTENSRWEDRILGKIWT